MALNTTSENTANITTPANVAAAVGRRTSAVPTTPSLRATITATGAIRRSGSIRYPRSESINWRQFSDLDTNDKAKTTPTKNIVN